MTSTICKVTNKFVVEEKVLILAENYSQTHRYAINVGLHNLIGGYLVAHLFSANQKDIRALVVC